MIPPIISADVKSPGEKEIFELLKNDPLSSDWLVLHSLDTAKHVKQIFGEIDFVIIIPKKGILVLEVKAVKYLSRQNGNWVYGRTQSSIGPFKQASMAMHSLRQYIEVHAPELTNLVYWSAVCFPFIEFSEKSVEWHSWQIIDRAAIRQQNLPELILNVLQNARKHLAGVKTAKWFKQNNQEPSIKQMSRLAQILRPEFELYESPKSRKERLGQELKKYTSEQLIALDAMEENKQVVFSGPAGTGKTLLAIEAARRATANGSKVLFICFNKQLSNMLRDELRNLGTVEITTLHSFFMHLTELDLPSNNGNFWNEELPQLAINKLFEMSEPPKYDVLIIDEAQDILQWQYLEILDLCLVNGFDNGYWRVFGDFEKQNIYHPDDQLDIVEFIAKYGNNASRFKLLSNCRNTPQIAQLASTLAELEPGYKKILRPDNGILIKTQYYKNNKQQEDLLIKTLGKLLEQGFEKNEIVVLSTKSNANSCAGNISTEPWINNLTGYSYEITDKIRYSSIYSFKGLEAEVIIISDIETLDRLEPHQLFYVAVSRAIHNLIIIASNTVQKNIESILSDRPKVKL